MALSPGTTIGPYRIIEPLGRGGMASVYRAYEAALDRDVALKVLPSEFLHDETFAERFQREAKTIARLEHPKIVPIFAYGIDQGVPWMAMRLVSGGTLANLLRSDRLDGGRVVAILRGVAQALDYAHAKGVVHRDVKPQNVLLDEAERVYLADFGIARMVEGTNALTATGMISGTPHYMAPEQATGQHVDRRADVYALGIVAYEMLIGKVPFSADTPVAVLLKHVSEPMPLPQTTGFPEGLARALLKCTAKKPEDRWPSAEAFVDALERGLGGAADPVGRAFVPASDAGSGTLETLVAAPELDAAPGPPPAAFDTKVPARTLSASRRAAARAGVAVGGAAFLVMAASVAWLNGRRHVPSDTAPSAAAVPGSAGPAAPAAPAARSGESASGGPGTEANASASLPPAEVPARLTLDIEHSLETGALKVWVDRELVLSKRLEGKEQKKLIAFKGHKGALRAVLDVKPGSHIVRVQVTWDDNNKTETIGGTFKAGSSRHLEVRVGGLRKNLSLEWS
jgi:tRNA A-37 threonylcarbamoyl transferase component Bud32